MSDPEYLIKDLCRVAGIDDWRCAVEDRHLVVDGRVVGLISEDGDASRDSLAVYVELDALAPVRYGEIAPLLLQANIHRTRGMQGWFGLHAETGRVVYCFNVNAAGHIDGGMLAELLGEQIHCAEAALAALAI
jgi:hypothetical protein